MSTSKGSGASGGGLPAGTTPPTPEGFFDQDLVGMIANEFYADTPPHQPESAIPKSDPVRGRDAGEEASSLLDVANQPENALGLQSVATPHGVGDPSYYFMEHPETPESPQGTPSTPNAPSPTDALHPESSANPLGGQGAASQAGADASPAAAGAQQQAPEGLFPDPSSFGVGGMPTPDHPHQDVPRSTPGEPVSPASADQARPESGFDPAKLQALFASSFGGIPSLYGTPEAGKPATPDMDPTQQAAPHLGSTAPETPAESGGGGYGAGSPGTPKSGSSKTGSSKTGAPEGGTGGFDLSAIQGLAAPAMGGMPQAVPGAEGKDTGMAGFQVPAGPGLEAFGLPASGGTAGAPAEAGSVPATPVPDAEPDFYFLPRVDAHEDAHETPIPTVETGSSGGLDPHVVRNDFPILHQKIHGKPLIWMDNAATTQKPQAVIDRISHFYEHDYSNIHRGAHTLAARATDAYEDAREKLRRFIGAGSTDELIYVRGCTEGMNLIAQTWGRKNLGEGDEIILTTLEHHANIVPWQMLSQERGIRIRVAPVNERGEIIMEQYAQLLNPRTKLVGVTHVSNALGSVQPVEEMIQAAHRHNVPVVVDGAQSVPHMRIDVQAMDADFYVFSGHKMYGPSGVGIVYGKMEHLEDMPPWQGGGNMIQSVTWEHTTYSQPPAKFEAGTPTITDAVGLGAAVDYIERLGIDNINRYEHFLTDYAMERLPEIPGIRLIGTSPGKVSVLSFVIDGARTEDVGRYLDREGIAVRAGHHCAMPTMQRFGVTGTIRPSIAIYNTTEEVDFLIDVLKRYKQS